MSLPISPTEQIAIFTDFGSSGPYVGQMKAVLYGAKVKQPVYDLVGDAPQFDPKASAYLLASLLAFFPVSTVVIAVVDPGVGGDRLPLLVEVDSHYLVGPDNGLFSQVIAQAKQGVVTKIDWLPSRLSTTFHGRDLFAPVAAMVANQQLVPRSILERSGMVGNDWPDDLAEVIYIDHYGNAICGVRVAQLQMGVSISLSGQVLSRGDTFSQMPKGQPFWYQNSMGLLEVAVNQARADQVLGLEVGTKLLLGGST